MSEANVAIIREVYKRYLADPESALELFDPEVEWIEPPDLPDTQTYRGRDGVRASLRKFTGTWENYRIAVLDLIDVGESVIAHVHHTGRGKGSGAAVDFEQFHIWALRDGQVVRLEMFSSRDEANRAAGLAGSERT